MGLGLENDEGALPELEPEAPLMRLFKRILGRNATKGTPRRPQAGPAVKWFRL
jgi:hypothetical protein